MVKKFYVGAKTVLRSDWIKPSMNEAIKFAEELLDEDPLYEDCDEIPIVQVVAIVKRIKPKSRFTVKRA